MDIDNFYTFENKLIEGVIVKRKSQFTIIAKVNDIEYICHCPTTGRIGNFDLSERPCLLSLNKPGGKTAYTIEAVSLNKINDENKKWIGINQNAINRYVEFFLNNNCFSEIFGSNLESIKREQFLGNSKLDFLVDNTYLEVKTPLQNIQLDIPNYVKTKKVSPFSSTDHFVKHISELSSSLKNNERAILLVCFIYDNPGFEVIDKSTKYEKVKTTVNNVVKNGVEFWQVNFEITLLGIFLKKYFLLKL